MESLIVKYFQEWGGPTLVLVFIVFWWADKKGWIRNWSSSATKERTSEREQLSEDQQNLIINLRKDIDDLRRWRAEDQHECDRKLDQMNNRIDFLFIDNDKWRIDATKWRHLSENIGMYIDVLRSALRSAGIESPKFDGWRQFISEGGTREELSGFPTENDPR